MKLLFFLFSFAAIVAFGVTCVAPMLQKFVEGDLVAEIKESKLSKKYSITQVKMDHFHLKEITVKPKNDGDSLDDDLVKKEIVELIDPILGIYAQDCDVDLIAADPKIVTHQKDKVPELGPPPGETPDVTIVKKPASFSIRWTDKEAKLVLEGNQTNKTTSKSLIESFEKAKNEIVIKSGIKVDNRKVANSKYLMRALQKTQELIMNSDGDLSVDFKDALQTSVSKKKGYLKFKGTTGDLEEYDALTQSFQGLESDDFEVHNDLMFYPYVSIKKDALKEKIILTGYVKDRIDLGTLGSNASKDVADNFSTDNTLVTHERCLDIRDWHTEYAETLIAKHMKNVVDGEIIYRNNELYRLSGVSHDAGYVKEVKQAFKDPKIAQNLIYKELPQKKIELVEPEPVRPETLAEQLDEYKIHFGSGKSKVDERYNVPLDEIARKIKASADKTSKIIVGGYADTSGSAEGNKILSLKRARSVMSGLVGRGVDASRIEVEFFGAEANGKTKAESRRVEIRVRKK